MEAINNQCNHAQVYSRHVTQLNVCLSLKALFRCVHSMLLLMAMPVRRMLGQIRTREGHSLTLCPCCKLQVTTPTLRGCRKEPFDDENWGRRSRATVFWLGLPVLPSHTVKNARLSLRRAVALPAGVGVWCIDPCLRRDCMHRARHLRMPPGSD
jgi:hypothetical protein